MRIAFYDTKQYDKIWFEKLNKEYEYKIKFYEDKLNSDTCYSFKKL